MFEQSSELYLDAKGTFTSPRNDGQFDTTYC